jgi:uncharacterized protein (DUF302 family)
MMARTLLLARALILVCFPTVAFSDDGLITVQSKYSAKDTVERFELALKLEGWKIIIKLDNAYEAAAYGVNIPARTTIVFDNMKVWIDYLIQTPTVAIDLPHKVLVWEDHEGVWVTRNSAQYYRRILGRHELTWPFQLDAFYETLSSTVAKTTQ